MEYINNKMFPESICSFEVESITRNAYITLTACYTQSIFPYKVCQQQIVQEIHIPHFGGSTLGRTKSWKEGLSFEPILKDPSREFKGMT